MALDSEPPQAKRIKSGFEADCKAKIKFASEAVKQKDAPFLQDVTLEKDVEMVVS